MEELCKICKDPNKSLIQREAKMAGRLIPILQRERERERGGIGTLIPVRLYYMCVPETAAKPSL